MTLRSLALATLLLVGAAAPAPADVTLFTSLAQAGSGGAITCSAVNIGRNRIDLDLLIFDSSSSLVASTSCSDWGPGAICSLPVSGPVQGFCRILSSGNKKSVRGALAVTDANGNSVLSLEAH